ncbi:phosphatase [Pleomorphomonas oryzae]|uniref:phosphatase n=1 Tax=Pleomorphomonas oryzae TaxID=261934 RepID=UPI000421CA90|nr:phosphatase [Pleomorphomonas oryzae]
MIEIHSNLFVGDEKDEQHLCREPGWFFIHACKDPYHRRAVGYTGRGAPKDHPEYLIAHRDGHLFLNLVDTNDVAYVPMEIVEAALEAIHRNLGTTKVLLHCNQGQSRSPSIALLYLRRHTNRFAGMAFVEALQTFQLLYPPYSPARGMADYVRLNWDRYQYVD